MAHRYCCSGLREIMEWSRNSDHCTYHTADECPDRVLVYSEKFTEYGIAIHDGTISWIAIQFCPWCGTRFPPSTRPDEPIGFTWRPEKYGQ